jgi:Ferric reductase like transmembrane component
MSFGSEQSSGVLVSHGDQGGGYLVMVEDGRLWFVHNDGHGTTTRVDGGALADGDQVISLELETPGKRVWNAVLRAGDAELARADGLAMLFPMAPFEGISIGIDRRSPVDWDLRQRRGTFAYSWSLSRATGIVATVLAAASLVFGFFFSSRNTGDRRRPAWWLDLHNWLGGLALAFTVIHVVTIVLDSDSAMGTLQALVPGTAHDSQWAVTFGVIAMYSFVAVTFTSWPRKRLGRPWWRVLHLTSVAGLVLAAVHGYQRGTDAPETWFKLGLIVGTGVAVYGLGVRVLALALRRAS